MCVRVCFGGVRGCQGRRGLQRVCVLEEGVRGGVHKAQAAAIAMQAQFWVSKDSQGRPASNVYSHTPLLPSKLLLTEPSPPSLPQKTPSPLPLHTPTLCLTCRPLLLLIMASVSQVFSCSP